MERPSYRCIICSHKWSGRKQDNGKYVTPKNCPNCQSKKWSGKDTQTKLVEYEDKTNKGGQEWFTCMYFDDTKDVIESCAATGHNVATIEVPLGTVDITWRSGLETRPAAHPSERGCYLTMPLVLCIDHIALLAYRVGIVKAQRIV